MQPKRQTLLNQPVEAELFTGRQGLGFRQQFVVEIQA